MKYLLLISSLLILGAGCALKTAVRPAVTTRPGPNLELESTGLARQETVTITSNGFSPKEITVKQGAEVIFKNMDSADRWPASAPHPTHTNYPEFDPKKPIKPGASWSFTANRVGSFFYHEHLNPIQFGKMVVTE